MIPRKEENLCTATKEDGSRCQAVRMKNSPGGFCWFHSRSEKEDLKNDIVSWMEEGDFKSLFGNNQETWFNWKVVLKAIFALEMTEDELEVFKTLTGRTTAPSKPFREVYLIIGRRGGKSFISALVTCFMALQDWSQWVRKGESAECIIVASDREQAQVVFGYVREIFSISTLKDKVKKELRNSLELKSGVTISIRTASFRGIRGRATPCVVCDELSFYKFEGINTDKQILTAIKPSTLTIPGSLVLGISTPWMKSGVMWEKYQEHYGKDDSPVLIVKGTSLQMNPNLSKEIIESEIKSDSANISEYQAEFVENLEAFLPSQVIDGIVVKERVSLPYETGRVYNCYIDPSSGVGKDRFAMAISFWDWKKKKVVLAYCAIRKPKFRVSDVVENYAKIIKGYRIFKIHTDRYGTGFIQDLFEKQGIHVEVSQWTSSQVFLEFQPMAQTGGVELLDNPEMIEEFKNLEMVRRQSGNHFVGHPQWSDSFHDDLCLSVAGSCIYTALQPSYTADSPEMLARLPVKSDTVGKDSLSKLPPWELDELVKEGKVHKVIISGRPHYLRASIDSKLGLKEKQND